ncbi:MAG: acyl carrier protein [Myxococcota bacterium]
MTREAIIETLRQILKRQLGQSVSATLDTDLRTDLELDSLKQLAVIVEIENEFRISFEPEDDTVTTVGQLVSVIEKHLRGEQVREDGAAPVGRE